MPPLTEERGFTLVEVIIGMVILFSVIVVGTAVQRNSSRAMEQLTAATTIATALPYIMDTVREELEEKGRHNGEGDYDIFLSFSYTATENKRSRSMKSATEELTAQMEYGSFDVQLLDIHLTVNYQPTDGDGRQEIYDYHETLWSRSY